ncbi:immunoglobulin-like domain-containing receptor 1a [Brachyhypopomus gauderio]|uniref:immunoglobulin-like domain-containing receptor 1a n=1 Tax=Brachyhypopomus gauderio TaxID=698409 RepID=UPI004042F4D0
MGKLLVPLVLSFLISDVLSVLVTVPVNQMSTGLFVPITLRCDYSTSANLQNVLVTWVFKSFCKDPVLNYYSAAYQADLQMGQDPSNNCPDSQRTVRTVAQKQGSNMATLGPDYRNRKISIENQADLLIGEVMWWDNGLYVCSVNAPGDTTGYPNAEIKLIVYNWLTVLFMIIGVLLLIILICVCCCQCCPQRCCCYIRCPCCPKTCCCPEKTVMQYRMMKDAQKAMSTWPGSQPMYAPLSTHSSAFQMDPMMYAGSAGKMAMTPIPPLPLPLPPQAGLVSMAPPSIHGMPPPSIHGNGSSHGTNQMLDFLENQVRGLDVQSQPAMQHMPPPPQHMPQNVPFSAGPPSMLSALNDGPASRRPPPGSRGGRPPTNSSGSSSYAPPRRDDRRYPPPSRHHMTRSYSQEDILDNRSRGADLGYRPRSRSRDDLLAATRDTRSRQDDREYWGSASDDDSSRRGGARGGARGGPRGRAWNDHPPSYTEYEPEQKPTKRPDRFSENGSRSGNSIVI